MKYYTMNIDEILKELDTSIEGLNSNEIDMRKEKYGLNILPKAKKNTLLKVFLNQFLSPIVLILLVAALVSLIIGEFIDTIFVVLVVLMDAILGTIQEWKAEKNASHLQNLIKVNSTVKRNNEKLSIDSEDLTIGDIVIVEPGEKITADLRIIEAHNLTVDEAFLTGESIASNKSIDILDIDTPVADRDNMLYAGSTILSGRGIGVVVGIATNTEIGKIASNVIESDNTKTPLTIRMERFTKQISMILGVVALILTVILYFKGEAPKEIFFAVVALSISAIPEGLPMVLTVALSIASNKMAKKNVIVRKLNSVEGLGSCTVIACDKTGTLTLNEQTAKIVELVDGSIFDIEGNGYNGIGNVIPRNASAKYKDSIDTLSNLGKLAYLNNEAKLSLKDGEWISHGDAIDIAFLSLNLKINKREFNNEIVGTIPYESENKYSAVFYKDDEQVRITLKGSIETILKFCNNNSEDILKKADNLASLGYRVIAIADGKAINFKEKDEYNDSDINKLDLIGLIGFIDPIRKESKQALMECKKAGIKVVMITGDHPLTAEAIGKDLGMINNKNEIASGKDIEHNFNLGERVFDNFVKDTIIFSRVTPEQKLKIVESFKRQGEFIAVTGDGVNDAPAMKSANIGIAMGSGTDVAKETGALIITDDNFMSIVSGIKEGRHAYNNIRKVIYYLISCGLAEVFFFMLSIIFNLPMPLLAVQLLWLNLVTDGIQDVALAFENSDDDVMNEKPRNPNESIFDKILILETLTAGITTGLLVFIFWFILIKPMNMEINHARSYIILLMVFMQNIHVFNCRSEKESAFKCPLKNNWFVVIAVICTLILQLIVSNTSVLSKVLGVYPIKFIYALMAFLFALPLLLIMELFKKLRRS